MTGKHLDCIETIGKSGVRRVKWTPYENRFIGYDGKTIYAWTDMGAVSRIMDHHKRVFSEHEYSLCNDIENTIISYYNFASVT